MSVAIVRNGKLAYAKGFGYADLQNEIRATPDTIYRIGSVTKPFTATMIMQLVREGKLGLDDPVRRHLPDLPATWGKVTVRQLLNHTGGVPNYTSLPKMMEEGVRVPTTPRGIVATVEKMPLDFEPGSHWSYSNTGYEILGLLIEKYDSRPYGDSLGVRILTPLGMRETCFTTDSRIVKHRAQGYTIRGGKTENCDFIDMSWPYAAGSMESSVIDLAKWDGALCGDGILPQSILKQMWTKTRLSSGGEYGYGTGWELRDNNGIPIVEHSGGIPGFISILKRAPSKGLTVIVLTNCDSGDAGGVADRLLGFLDPDFKPKPPKGIVDRDPATSELARTTLLSIMAGNLDRSILGVELAKRLTPEFLEEGRKQLNGSGQLKRFVLIEARDEDGKKIRTYGITLGETLLKLEFALGSNGLIEGFGIHP